AFEEEGVKLLDELKVGRTVKVRKISLYKKTLGLEDLPEESWAGRIADVVVPDDPLKEPVQAVVEFADGRTRQLHASVFDLVTASEVPRVPEPTLRDLARAVTSGAYRTVDELPPPLKRVAAKIVPDAEKLNWPDITKGILTYAARSAVDLDYELKEPLERMRLFGKLLEDTGSGPMGSNAGSWHIDRSTGERWYVKFYRDPDQARCEYIANRLYHELGVPVPELRLALKDDRLAAASRELRNIRNVPPDVLMRHKDVRKGFVADAWMANWDVVGLGYDNIVMAGDRAYRMDQGGALLFRARGAPKGNMLKPDEVPELSTLKDPSINPQAAVIFREIPREAIIEGIRRILDLPEVRIRQYVVESGMEDARAERLITILLGRRRYLKGMLDMLQPPPLSETAAAVRESARVAEALLNLDRSLKKRLNAARGVGLRLDTDLVENLYARVRMITEATGEKIYMLTLKLTETAAATLEEKLRVMGGQRVSIEWTALITSGGKARRSPRTGKLLGYGTMVRNGPVKMTLADTSGRHEALKGYVRFEVRADRAEQFVASLEQFLSSVGVERLIWEVEPEYDKIYKLRRVAWQQRKESLVAPFVSYGQAEAGALNDAELAGLLERTARLELKEVSPGYFIYVDPGQSGELAENGASLVFHSITGENKAARLMKIIRSGSLLSSLERYESGVLVKGMSTAEDFETGGADSVFARLLTVNAASNPDRYLSDKYDIALVFKKEVLDRTDWYAYTEDLFGRTTGNDFTSRPSPVEFVRMLVRNWNGRNEIMFRKALSLGDIDHIVIRDRRTLDQILEKLKKAGVRTIAGRPVEEVFRCPGM
ncbi:MAG: hypothetical protein ABIN58_05285, partial [candidate division WOR-3 bacterium]